LGVILGMSFPSQIRMGDADMQLDTASTPNPEITFLRFVMRRRIGWCKEHDKNVI